MSYDYNTVKNRFLIFVFLPTVAVCIVAFWIRGILLLDPDFGWHLRLGEIIINQGFPKTDPFSYSMPSYPFIDYEWGSNVLIYLGYNIVGTVGLAAIYAVIGVGALWLMVDRKSIYSLAPFLFGSGVMIGAAGIRPQVISWLFLAILLRLLTNETTWKKWKWVLPFLMIVWVNLHGSFPIGLAIAGLILALRWYQNRKIDIQDMIVLFLSAGATLINPYGWRDIYEVIRQMILGGELMRKGIAEWMPSYKVPNMSFWMLVGLSVFLNWRYRKKLNWGEVGASAFLVFGGIVSLRNMSLFAVSSALVVNRGLNELRKQARSLGVEKRFIFFIKILIVISAVVFMGEGTISLIKARQLSEEAFYPKKAVEFLKKENYPGRLFSDYGWGGYLIWKYPEKKVYIDGRMSNFVWRAPEEETDYVFKEYLELMEGKQTIIRLFRKYRIETVLLPTRHAEGSKITKIFSWFWKEEMKKEESFFKQLEEAGWIKVYKDNISEVYRKSSN